MKKETYLRKLEAMVITDENTVAEAKTAQRVKTELKRFWKKAALEYVRKNQQPGDPNLDLPNMETDIHFDLKPNGLVIVNVLDMYSEYVPYPPYRRVEKKYSVPKKNLFS
jgi:hypothetical protein